MTIIDAGVLSISSPIVNTTTTTTTTITITSTATDLLSQSVNSETRPVAILRQEISAIQDRSPPSEPEAQRGRSNGDAGFYGPDKKTMNAGGTDFRDLGRCVLILLFAQ